MNSRPFRHFYLHFNHHKELLFFIALSFVVIAYFLAPFYGILPLNKANTLAILYTALGKIECLSNGGMGIVCDNAGYPEGSCIPFGLPFAYLAAFIRHSTGISPLNAYDLSGILFLALGWTGVFLIIRRFGGNLLFSISGSLLFFLMPIVWGKSSYAFLMWGFAVAPFFMWLDLWYFRTRLYYLSFPVMLCSKCILLFMEPYTFVITFLFTASLMIYEFAAAKYRHKLDRALYLKEAVVLLSALAAYALYKAYIPGGAAYNTMSMDFFRGQGIDLIALFYKGTRLYHFPTPWNISIADSRLFYTDGESLRHVYIGIVLLAVIPLAIIFRTSLRRRNLLLLGVGIIAFVLSLGPSLKINDRRDPNQLSDTHITVKDYSMPEDAATLSMPYAFVYKLPPIKYMRSVSRWHLLTMLSLIVTFMALSSILWKHGYRGKLIALLIVGLAFAEYWPYTKNRYALINSYTRGFERFNASALDEFKRIVSPDDIVLFLKPGGVANEYLSTYLCSMAKCRTYNVSGDKALGIARKQWPKLINDTAKRPDAAKIEKILESNLASVIVFPHFDMRWNSYSWPPDDQTIELTSESVGKFRNGDDVLEYEKCEWFSTFRLKNKRK